MKLVTIQEVRDHCRAEPEDDALLTIYADAAEQAAEDFLNRRIFPRQTDLDTAIAGLPTAVAAAETAYGTARDAARGLSGEARCVAMQAAEATWKRAVTQARETAIGIVVNPAIKDAVLLIAGHLYRNRESVITGTIATEIPEGPRTMLWPHRVGLGV